MKKHLMNKHNVKIVLFGLGLLLILASFSGCLVDLGLGGGVTPGPGNQLTVVVNPPSGYPPLDVTITASGVTEGQYTITVGGHTYTQGSNIKPLTLYSLPCEGEVVWERPGYATQRAQFYIALDNKPPVVGRLRLNGLDDLWYLHPRHRYICDNPDVYDPEGGPVTLVDVHVQVARKGEEDTVFCPPYAGPGIYHAFDRNHRLIENAFVFHSTWTGPVDTAFNIHPLWHKGRAYAVDAVVNWGGAVYQCKKKIEADPDQAHKNHEPGLSGSGWKEYWKKKPDEIVYGTGLPFSPPGYGESGYPGNGTNCSIDWSKVRQPATETTITETWQDQDGGETTKSWTIPTGPDPGCNIY